jgi:hypothetical protein
MALGARIAAWVTLLLPLTGCAVPAGPGALPPEKAAAPAAAPPAGHAPAPGSAESRIPPYRTRVQSPQDLPRVLPAAQFRDEPIVAKAYDIAARMPAVVAQQPCFCGCDVSHAHTSLLDCFATPLGSACTICLKEVFVVDEMTREGAPAAAIREALVQGAWKAVRLEAH